MRRLYLQIYLAFLGILLAFAFVVGASWWFFRGEQEPGALRGLATLASRALPGTDEVPGRLQTEIDTLAEKFAADITVRAPDGRLLAHHGEPLPPAPPGTASGMAPMRGQGPRVVLRLDDGRWVIAKREHRHGGWLWALAGLAIAIALGAYPLVRRITGRLERLQRRVDALGAGDLSARVEVEGRDEVAELAQHFNHAAERIEKLVQAQRQMLAAASHELRSPLARLRLGMELIQTGAGAGERAQIERDIAELDELIGEILIASRLDSAVSLDRLEAVDLLALVAEEANRTGAEMGGEMSGEMSGESLTLRGEPRLLRRLVRNLLENARRYAAGSAVEARLRRDADGGFELKVEDRGPGVAESERERIFEPFYRVAGAHETGEGVGLGLALVRKIAERHGGSARCLAREGGGTSFVVQLRDVDGS